MSEQAPVDPTQSSGSAPPAEGDAAQSKKGAKKEAAKKAKEAEKARKAAEREAAQAAQKSAAASEDLATDNYGDILPTTKVEAEKVKLKDLGEQHLDKT